MAPEKTASIEAYEDNVFERLLSLPTVSSTCEVIERTYASTKQTHPLFCSVCGVYERGARTVSSLAVWSIQPAIQRLGPQLVAANNMACKGLDRLEENIPALQYPPEKLASGFIEAVTSTVQIAKDGITTALTLAESLVNYILPASSEENESDALWEQESDVSAPGPQPSHRRFGALASTVCRRVYSQTAVQLQRTKSQGQALVTCIPGVSPVGGYAMKNLEAVGTVGLAFQNSVTGLFSWDQQRNKEETRETNGDIQSVGGLQSLVDGLGNQLQRNYIAVVSSVKSAPQTTVGLAKDGLDVLFETWGSTREYVVKSVSQNSVISGFSSSSSEGSIPGCSAGDEDLKESRIHGAPDL